MTAQVIHLFPVAKQLENPPNRIRELRLAAGLTLAQLGDMIGVKHHQISRFETGERDLNLEWLRRIAQAFTRATGRRYDAGMFLNLADNAAVIAETEARLLAGVAEDFGRIVADRRGEFRAEPEGDAATPRRA